MKGQHAEKQAGPLHTAFTPSPSAAVKIEKCLQIHTHLTVIMSKD